MRGFVVPVLALSSVLVLSGCGSDDSEGGGEGGATTVEAKPWEVGPYPAGHRTVQLDDDARGRSLVIEVWYPAAESARDSAETGAGTETFEEDETAREVVSELLAGAPASCPSRRTRAARDAEVRGDLGGRPLVAFSHCYNCGRYTSFSVMERLASHGFIVVAPDHSGPLPFAEGAEGESLGAEQLEVRAADLRFAIDAAIGGSLGAGLEVDVERIGALGHSFGSVTAGRTAQVDERVKAAAGLAAPMENPLIPGVSLSEIDVPLFLLLAEEDNSIGEIGNDFLRSNFEDANPPITRLDVADAGHWSVSDLCGLTEALSPGCGQGVRHSKERQGESFDYLPVSEGIAVTQRYVASFFLAELTGNAEAAQFVAAEPEANGLSISSRR